MIRRNEHEHLGILSQAGEEPCQLVIQLADAGVVEIHEMLHVGRIEADLSAPKRQELRRRAVGPPGVRTNELLLVRGQRAIVAVHVVIVNEEKPPLPGELARPGERLLGDRPCRLALVDAFLHVAKPLEAALETKRRAQIVGVHDGTGREAGRSHPRSERRHLGRQLRVANPRDHGDSDTSR